MRTVSDRRRRRDAVYADRRRAVWERAGGSCEAGVLLVCSGAMQEVHHRAGRRIPDPHRMENLLGCCSPCHRFIHEQPTAALAAGWSVPRTAHDLDLDAVDDDDWGPF
jgi:5-methylcytosine-specific restriction endonuclease McrA